MHERAATRRYSQDRILEGVRVCLSNVYGVDDPFDEDTPLVAWYRDAGLSDECPLVMLECIASYFGLRYGQTRWAAWLRLPRHPGAAGGERMYCISRSRKQSIDAWEEQIAPTITFGDLARYLAKRATAVSLEPVTVFGSRCEAAGVFLGITKLPGLRAKRIAPSTPLLQGMRRCEAPAYFDQVAWAAEAELPPVRRYESVVSFRRWDEALVNTVFWIAVAAGFYLAVALHGAWGGSVFLWVPLNGFCLAMGLRQAVLNKIAQPLPDGVDTFGDLARLIATRRKTTPLPVPA